MEELPNLYFMRARYYSAEAGVFLSTDPVKHIGPKWQPIAYGYANGNPLAFTDPNGEFAHILGGAIVGSFVGVGSQFVSDIISVSMGGEWSGADAYAGAAIGGFVSGGVFALTGNPWFAGAAGGAVGNATSQIVKNGGLKDFNAGDMVVAAGVSSVASGLGSKVKIPGITGGKGNDLAVTKQMATKVVSGQISPLSISSATWGKMATGVGTKSLTSGIAKTLTRGAVDAAQRATGFNASQTINATISTASKAITTHVAPAIQRAMETVVSATTSIANSVSQAVSNTANAIGHFFGSLFGGSSSSHRSGGGSSSSGSSSSSSGSASTREGTDCLRELWRYKLQA